MRQAAQRLVLDQAEVLAAEADGAREDDLRVDPALVHHLEADFGVPRALTWTCSCSHSFSAMFELSLWPSPLDHRRRR